MKVATLIARYRWRSPSIRPWLQDYLTDENQYQMQVSPNLSPSFTCLAMQ